MKKKIKLLVLVLLPFCVNAQQLDKVKRYFQKSTDSTSSLSKGDQILAEIDSFIERKPSSWVQLQGILPGFKVKTDIDGKWTIIQWEMDGLLMGRAIYGEEGDYEIMPMDGMGYAEHIIRPDKFRSLWLVLTHMNEPEYEFENAVIMQRSLEGLISNYLLHDAEYTRGSRKGRAFKYEEKTKVLMYNFEPLNNLDFGGDASIGFVSEGAYSYKAGKFQLMKPKKNG